MSTKHGLKELSKRHTDPGTCTPMGDGKERRVWLWLAVEKWKARWVSRIEVITTRNRPVYPGMLWSPVPIPFPKGKTPRDLNLSQHKNKNKAM